MNNTTIYAINVLGLKDETVFNSLYNTVSNERKQKIDRLKFLQDKKLSLAVEVLLNYALKENGVKDFEILYTKEGKPYLKDNSVKFSLSHSKDFAVCVLSDREVGCDIEKIESVNLNIAKRYFTEREYNSIMQGKMVKEQTDLFFGLWTDKESFIKATGLGLNLSLKDFEILQNGTPKVIHNLKGEYYLQRFSDIKGYSLSVCTVNSLPNANLKIVELKDIL